MRSKMPITEEQQRKMLVRRSKMLVRRSKMPMTKEQQRKTLVRRSKMPMTEEQQRKMLVRFLKRLKKFCQKEGVYIEGDDIHFGRMAYRFPDKSTGCGIVWSDFVPLLEDCRIHVRTVDHGSDDSLLNMEAAIEKLSIPEVIEI